MSTTKPRPLEHRHDISRLHSMAMKQIPDFFRKLTLPTNVPWLDISNEPGFDSKEYYPRAAHLGMILDSATGGLTKVIACLEHIGEVAILTHSSGKPLIRASRLLLGNTMWFAPYCYAANNGERSKQDKIEALTKYYFTDMSYATDFVDVDGKSFQSFKLACNKIAEKLEELKLVQESRDIDRKEAKRSKKPSILLSGTNGYASSSVHTRTNPYTAETDRTVGAGDTDEDEETKSSPTQLRKRPNDDSPVQAKRLKSQHQIESTSAQDVNTNEEDDTTKSMRHHYQGAFSGIIKAADSSDSPSEGSKQQNEEDTEDEDSEDEEEDDEADRSGNFVYGVLQELIHYDTVTALNKAAEAREWWPDIDPDSLLCDEKPV